MTVLNITWLPYLPNPSSGVMYQQSQTLEDTVLLMEAYQSAELCIYLGKSLQRPVIRPEPEGPQKKEPYPSLTPQEDRDSQPRGPSGELQLTSSNDEEEICQTSVDFTEITSLQDVQVGPPTAQSQGHFTLPVALNRVTVDWRPL